MLETLFMLFIPGRDWKPGKIGTFRMKSLCPRELMEERGTFQREEREECQMLLQDEDLVFGIYDVKCYPMRKTKCLAFMLSNDTHEEDQVFGIHDGCKHSFVLTGKHKLPNLFDITSQSHEIFL